MGIEKLSDIWPQWQILGEIGGGSHGIVYKALREEHGVKSYAAIKVITIPQQKSEMKSLRADRLDENAMQKYFEDIVANTVNEIKMMESMKGTSNIVSIEDYRVLKAPDKIGYDIFIRMEFLTPFLDFIADKKPDEPMVIKLGIDICNALELCEKQNLIHRDVKPENIFISQFGDFKIGDFGIARELEAGSGSLSVSGTQNYMAPEVQSMHYDGTVDIYSLGLVLYKLLNNNRLPFLDPTAKLINPQAFHTALERRFSGEELPDPIEAGPELAGVIRKACAYDPKKRFQTSTDFKNALKSLNSMNGMNTVIKIKPVKTEFAAPVKTKMIYREYSTPLIKDGNTSSARPPAGVNMPPAPSQQGPGYIKKQATPGIAKQAPDAEIAGINGKANIIAIVILIISVVVVGILAWTGP